MGYLRVYQSNEPFKLKDSFLDAFKRKQPKWGPIGYVTYKRTYAREITDGVYEEFWQTAQRVVEGCYRIQQRHCKALLLPWNSTKAQNSAQEMYQRIWDFKFTPPGRGLWMMGTEYVEKHGSASLNNCSFVSTKDLKVSFSAPFCFLMDMSMLGVGVGGDTKGAGTVKIKQPEFDKEKFVVPDTREGWVNLVKRVLDSYVGEGLCPKEVDYSQVRPEGEKIKGFGGVASGPAPLIELVEWLHKILEPRIGQKITSADIVDIFNLVGKCVVSGNVRRCLPEGALVHTEKGLYSIEDVCVGDRVLTADGYKRVTSKFNQGQQKLVRINTKDGFFDCTPNHKMAVLVAPNRYEWKKAEDLTNEDRLVGTRHSIEGEATSLPPWSYKKVDHSTTCIDITVPELDEDTAWLIGLFHADGYTYANRKENGFNAYVSIVVGLHEADIAKKAGEQLERWGVKPKVGKRKSENSIMVHVQSKQLAWYFDEHFKKPNTTIVVPEFILKAKKSIRLAYVAGVSDGDGSLMSRPVTVADTVYADFAKQLQTLLYSCGIESRLSIQKKEWASRAGWQKIHSLDLINYTAVDRFKQIPQLTKKVRHPLIGRKTSTYPSCWFSEKRAILHASKTTDVSINRYDIVYGEDHLIPIKVVSVDSTNEWKNTYDIEVEDSHEFFCEGYLTHNSAENMLGEVEDAEFRSLKDPDKNKDYLNNHRWASNNSLFATVGMDYTKPVEALIKNGEPGFFWLDAARNYSRMGELPDYKDSNVGGCNPCFEQSLESFECCCLCETYPANHDSYEDFQTTLKYAYLYSKTVTLLPTHDPRTNAVMLRNRRIGTSMSGIVQAMNKHGRRNFFEWCKKGFDYIGKVDKLYSDWLCVPASKKRTSVKPSGTVSLLCGATPGIHFPESEYYIRNMRVAKNSHLVAPLKKAGYPVEDDVKDNNSVVISFPIHEELFVRGKKDVTMWEQLELVAQMQQFWSDNQVSATIHFQKHEAKDIKNALELYEVRLKGISFLPLEEAGEEAAYPQMPYIPINKEQYDKMSSKLKSYSLKNAEHEVTEKFCDGDKCNLPIR